MSASPRHCDPVDARAPRVMQRLGMVGGDIEDAAIEFLRLSELLVFLQEDGDRIASSSESSRGGVSDCAEDGRRLFAVVSTRFPCLRHSLVDHGRFS